MSVHFEERVTFGLSALSSKSEGKIEFEINRADSGLCHIVVVRLVNMREEAGHNGRRSKNGAENSSPRYPQKPRCPKSHFVRLPTMSTTSSYRR